MQIKDDTPDPSKKPEIYPKRPPVNLLSDTELQNVTNFFAFEGIDGSGKSTVIREIKRLCEERNHAATVLRLGRSDLVHHAMARAIWLNSDPVTFNLLNWISVIQQVTEQRELLKSDAPVLFDRFVLSIKARGILEGMSTDLMDVLETYVPKPKVIFLLDCDPQICQQRVIASGRTITYFEAGARIVPDEGSPMIESDPEVRRDTHNREPLLLKHLVRMRKQFLDVAENYDNVCKIDASKPLDQVIAKVQNVMRCT